MQEDLSPPSRWLWIQKLRRSRCVHLGLGREGRLRRREGSARAARAYRAKAYSESSSRPMEKNKRQRILSWALVLALVVSCLLLGALQYHWIGEVSVAAREHLHESLEASLRELSREFDADITASCRRLIPRDSVADASAAEAEVSARFAAAKANGRDFRLFRSVSLAVKNGHGLDLRRLDFATGKFEAADWPEDWTPLRERLEARLGPPPAPGHFAAPDRRWNRDGALIEAPIWGTSNQANPRPREEAWVILNLNLDYLRGVLLPDEIQRRLGTKEYEVEVLNRSDSGSLVYRSDAREKDDLSRDADASVGLFNIPSGTALAIARDRPPDPRGGPPALNEPKGPPPDHQQPIGSLWELYVRNRAGSLEAVVARARLTNTLVTSGILLLLLATVAALIRFTRRAQRLAELQVEFVANVSHELRTPLTVIHTAAYNLKGAIASQPKQVERYGALIQRESARLRDLLEQVLQFASARAGKTIRERQSVSVPQVIAEAARSVQGVIEEAGCVLHQDVDPSLPPVLGDAAALRQALQNLIGNAVKYGAAEKWIGVTAKAEEQHPGTVEIRVLDHGPGIPEDEQEQIFEPFFRGRWAVRNQVHGTGLGLSLVKRVVEAHRGEIEVKSDVERGTEFIVRLPTIPAEKSYANSLN
jgi:signal transduction histidine kinase